MHGVRGRWLFQARVVPDVSDIFQPLEDAVYHMFLPALTGRPEPGKTERELLSLAARYGGLGLINPSEVAPKEFVASQHFTSSLVCSLVQQGTSSNNLARYPEQL